MKSPTSVFLSAFVLMVVMNTSLVFAQHNHGTNRGVSSDMMQYCQKHHSEMTALVDQASRTLAEGQELSSVDEMRAAMGRSQSQLSEMKERMSMCPMAQSAMTGSSDGHMKRMKCMSDQQETETKGQGPE